MKYGEGKGKVILVPYPAQGHVTPMLGLASTLVQHGGLQPILVIPHFIHHRISPQMNPLDGILCMSIPGVLKDGEGQQSHHPFFAIEEAMENEMPFYLESLLLKLNADEEEEEEGSRVAFVVVDLLASYAIGVASRLCIPVAGFWPASFATYRLIASIPHLLDAGILSEEGRPLDGGSICLGPGQPSMSAEELPWLIGSSSARKARFKFWNRTMARSRNIPWLLVNSFPQECFTDDHREHPPLGYSHYSNDLPLMSIVPIQPGCMDPQAFRNKKASFWEEDLSCLDWLNQQGSSSVVYVSFGSWVSPIGEAKIKSLALALEASDMPFLWVLNQAWLEYLPKGYADGVSKKGQAKIVSWAPQMEVLRHPSVGCYLTHCGWNSTMEAILCKKPLVCYPVGGDQFLNCAYIVNKWRIGIRIDGFRQTELEMALRRLREDWEMLTQGINDVSESFLGKVACQKAADYLASLLDSILNVDSKSLAGWLLSRGFDTHHHTPTMG